MNVASTAGFQPGPLMAVYYATKAYVISFSEAIANDYGKHNIRVNCVCPGPTDTGFAKRAGNEKTRVFKFFLREAFNRPIARVGTPEDVANAVVFLASGMAIWITGTQLVVDGGGLA